MTGEALQWNPQKSFLEAEEAMQKLVKPKHLRLMKGRGE